MELDLVPLNIARDIPDEVILQIASSLSAKDVLNLATTCKKLTSLLNTDDAWEYKVSKWIAEQEVRSGILGFTAEKIKELLGLHMLRSTYQALVELKCWPTGLWYCADSHEDSTFYPGGALVWVSIDGTGTGHNSESGTISAHVKFTWITPVGRYFGFQFPHPQELLTWRVQGELVSFEIRLKKGVFCSEVASVSMATSKGPLRFKIDLQDKSQFQLAQDPPHGDVISHFKRAGVRDAKTQQVLRQPPQVQPPPPPPPPGVYYAMYGGHGLEILQLECTEETRYTALKLIGDENVPACQISFKFDTSTDTRLGPYNSFRDDPFPTLHGPRPILSFERFSPFVVNMEQRPVSAVFKNAQGQINRDPSVWNPEWVAVTVVVYDLTDSDKTRGAARLPDEYAGNRTLDVNETAVFSVIFEGPGEDTRHVLDFFPVPMPQNI